MSATLVALIALLGTGLTGTLTWLLAWRVSRGRVATSDAASLWAESQALRTELREEARDLRGRVETLSGEVRNCHAESAALQVRLSNVEARLRGPRGR